MRKTDNELNELCNKLQTDRLWSWSRINKPHNSLYEYFLHYVLNVKEDRDDSIYKVTGGISHDILEKFYGNEISYQKMDEEFEDGWMTAFDIAELKFNRSDSEKNKSIADKYYYDLKHFFNNHKVIPHNVKLEQFVLLKLENTDGNKEYVQGYIDCCFKDENGVYTILDWKTSSIYRGEKAKNECGQLCLYAMALHQLGIPYEKIRIGWNFLKYVSVTVESKKGEKKVRIIERCELGEKLQANAKMWLKDYGCSEEELLTYLNLLAQTNDISVLPEEVRSKYEINDCYVYVELIDELINHWNDYALQTIKMIRNKEEEYEITKDEKLWWDSEEDIIAQSYYFSNLCGYSANLHKPYAAYLEKFNAERNGDLLSSAVNKEETDDMSWLNDL